MQSRLLNNLLCQARTTTDRRLWGSSICRAASHFARHGNIQEAIRSISMVRAEFKVSPDPEVAAWLMLAEGILHFFETKEIEAYDRTQRAYAIAKAINNSTIFQASAAWVAHLEFNSGNYDRMIVHLREALEDTSENNHQAHARASLVLANAFHFAGSFSQAKPWYERCRLHATAEGDDAMFGAMLHNIAAFRAADVRLSSAFGVVDSEEARRAWLEAQSSFTFDSAIRDEGLHPLRSLLRGQIMSAEGKHQEAVDILSTIDKNNLYSRLIPLLDAEVAWCLSELARTEEAWSHATTAIDGIDTLVDEDDIAYTYARASQAATRCGHEPASALWRDKAKQALTRHHSVQSRLLPKLQEVDRALT